MLKEHYFIWIMCVTIFYPVYVVKGAEKSSSDGTVSTIVKRSKYVEEVAEPIIIQKLKKMPVSIPILAEEVNGSPEANEPFSRMKDPTRPTVFQDLDSAEKESGSIEEDEIDKRKDPWMLTSTIVSPGRRTAIINGKSVSKGDIINGALILDIFPASVKIKVGVKMSILSMSSVAIREPSN